MTDRQFASRWLPWIISAAVACATAVAIVVLVRQNEQLRDARDELSDRVQARCSQFAFDLRSSAGRVGGYVEALKRAVTNDDIKRAEAAFDNDVSMWADLTRSSRATVSSRLYSELQFCASVRGVSNEQKDAAAARFNDAAARFRTTQDREEVARAVAEMAKVADEVSRWPLQG